MHKIAVFVGSLRAESINRKFAKGLEKLAGDRFKFHYVELGDLPIYNDDLWAEPPASALRLKADIEAADAYLFVTPEYNRSVPPVIVNAIAWGSRPKGKSSWAGKPAAVVGASDGAIGTAVSQSQLRSVLVILGIVLMGQPEVYFNFKPEFFDAEGNIADATKKPFFEKFLDRYDAWIKRVGPK